jgi:hypothetical protein
LDWVTFPFSSTGISEPRNGTLAVWQNSHTAAA